MAEQEERFTQDQARKMFSALKAIRAATEYKKGMTAIDAAHALEDAHQLAAKARRVARGLRRL